MNHQEFQDLAALSALGTITEAESAALAQHLETCPECSGVAREYREAATLIATTMEPVSPPPEARHQILSAIHGQGRPNREIHRSRPMWWLATAATVLVVFAVWNEFRVRTLSTEVAALRSGQVASEEKARRLQQQNDRLTGLVSALTSRETRTMVLSGQEIAPSASARVFLDAPHRRAFVFFDNLPQNPTDKSYQLWIIRADQASPQPAGIFDVNERGQAQLSVENLPLDTEIKAIAVTLEPRGGTTAPTGAMYLVGARS
jgi:anti-sigma-K factor RskA